MPATPGSCSGASRISCPTSPTGPPRDRRRSGRRLPRLQGRGGRVDPAGSRAPQAQARRARPSAPPACALLDRSPKRRSEGRLAAISTLLVAGPRAEELCNLLWRDVYLANGRIFIGRSKTQAGLREIDLLPILRDTLAAHKASAYRCGPDDLVFPTATGGRRDRHNLRSRTLGLAIKQADELLAQRGQPTLPRGLTTHKALVQGEGVEAMAIESLATEEAGS